MNDLTSLNAQPRVIKLGGEEHAIYPLSLDDWGRMQSWVDAQFPCPFEAVNRQIATGRYNVTQQQFLMKTAMELSAKSRRLIGTPEADELLSSMEGVKALLTLSIRKGNPGFSDADAERVYGRMTLVDVGRVFKETQAELVTSDPKAGPGTTTPAGTTTA